MKKWDLRGIAIHQFRFQTRWVSYSMFIDFLLRVVSNLLMPSGWCITSSATFVSIFFVGERSMSIDGPLREETFVRKSLFPVVFVLFLTSFLWATAIFCFGIRYGIKYFLRTLPFTLSWRVLLRIRYLKSLILCQENALKYLKHVFISQSVNNTSIARVKILAHQTSQPKWMMNLWRYHYLSRSFFLTRIPYCLADSIISSILTHFWRLISCRLRTKFLSFGSEFCSNNFSWIWLICSLSIKSSCGNCDPDLGVFSPTTVWGINGLATLNSKLNCK